VTISKQNVNEFTYLLRAVKMPCRAVKMPCRAVKMPCRAVKMPWKDAVEIARTFSFSISWKNEGIRLNFHQFLEFLWIFMLVVFF
jgi:hypothetical protein